MAITLTRTRLIVLAVAALAVGVFFLMDWLVVTDRERVETTLDELVLALETNDVAQIMPHLDGSFRIIGMTAEEFRDWYADLLNVMSVEKISRGSTEVRMDPVDRNRAEAAVRAQITLAGAGQSYPVDWRLRFQRRDEHTWKLAGVRAFQAIGNHEIDLRTVRGLIRSVGGSR